MILHDSNCRNCFVILLPVLARLFQKLRDRSYRISSLMGVDKWCKMCLRSPKGRCHDYRFLLTQSTQFSFRDTAKLYAVKLINWRIDNNQQLTSTIPRRVASVRCGVCAETRKYYMIVSQVDPALNHVLNVKYYDKNYHVFLWAKNGGLNQQWYDDADGTIRSVLNSYCLSNFGGNNNKKWSK